MYGFVFKDTILSCCLIYKENGNTIIYTRPMVKVSSDMWNFYLACPITRFISNIIPEGVAITTDLFSCSEKQVIYVLPYLPAKEPNKMAIGTKTAFGDVSAEQIIEWVEAYRYVYSGLPAS